MKRGARAGEAYVAVAVDGDGINEGIVDAFDDAGNDISDRGEKHGEDYGDGFSEGFLSRMRGKLADRLPDSFNSRDEAGRAGDEAGTSFVDRMADKVRTIGDKVGAELSDRLASNPEQVRRGIDRAFDDDFADRLGDRMGSRLAASMAESIDRQSDAIRRAVDGAVSGNGRNGSRGGRDGGLGGTIGRLFGAGSRNNGLNLIGKSIGGIVSLTEKAAKFATGFAEGISAAGKGAGLVGTLLSGLNGAGFSPATLAKGFSGLTATLPVLAISIGVVLFAASALVSVLGALLAIVIALSATIVSALVGALAVAGPLLGAFIAGAGLLVAAFTSMTEAQRTYLKTAFEPFHQAITGVGQIIFTEFTKPLYDGRTAIQVWADNLTKALVPLADVASKSAGAFARGINTITASLSGQGFDKFFTALGQELPSIIESLSSAFGKFLNGVGATFAVIMPYVTQFADYLERVATSFAKWSNSAKGQNSIADFVGRAIDSLKSFWGFLKEVGGLLADLFFDEDAQKSGNNMFDGMTAALQRFRGWLKKQDLKKWFDDAEAFAKDAKKALGRFVDLITDLYEDGTLEAIGDALSAMGDAFKFIDKWISPVIGYLRDGLADAIEDVLDVVQGMIDLVYGAVDAWNSLKDAIKGALDTGPGSSIQAPPEPTQPWDGPSTTVPQARAQTTGGMLGNALAKVANKWGKFGNGPDLDDLQESGQQALANTLESHGGHMAEPSDGDKDGSKSGSKDSSGKNGDKSKRRFEMDTEWVNPYKAWAEALLNQAEDVAGQIRASVLEGQQAIAASLIDVSESLASTLRDVGSSALSAVADAAKSLDASEIVDSFNSVIQQAAEAANAAMQSANESAASTIANANATREQMIATAQSAYDSAVAAVGAATTPGQAAKALKALKEAEANLHLARLRGEQLVEEARAAADGMIGQASASQDQIARVQNLLSDWSAVSLERVGDLISGVPRQNATLGDYAEARRIVAERLAAANDQLVNAIGLRDNYASSVADSVRSFGSLLTASAKTINGVTQALTAGDVTDNLSDRLTKIKTFQENLRQLLANGISEEAYKQLVDAGVDTGGAYAQAILDGGQGSISQVNDLTAQIGASADALGGASSSFLYQAGVDAAQGLVDGLTSLSSELESAATALGEAIAQAIRDALGIRSPSRVLIADMDYVGDGAAVGLDNQRIKVSAAAARLSEQIRVSPEVAAYASSQGASPTANGEGVSGNSPDTRFRDLIVHTPTEDPIAVAHEVVNEITGRLP